MRVRISGIPGAAVGAGGRSNQALPQPSAGIAASVRRSTSPTLGGRTTYALAVTSFATLTVTIRSSRTLKPPIIGMAWGQARRLCEQVCVCRL